MTGSLSALLISLSVEGENGLAMAAYGVMLAALGASACDLTSCRFEDAVEGGFVCRFGER